MADYYGIFHPADADTPIGQVYRREGEAEAALGELRNAVDVWAQAPFAGPVIEASYGAMFADCFVAALGVGEDNQP